MKARYGTIPTLVRWAGEQFGDHEALVDPAPDGEVRLSYVALVEAVHRAGRAFMTSGLEPGDCVGIWAPNAWEWVVAGLGVHEAGGVVVPINTRFKGREGAYVLAKSKARMLFTVTDFMGTDYVELLAGAEDLPDLREIVVLRGPTWGSTTSFDDFLDRADCVDDQERAARSGAVTADDLCLTMFTSGTTGMPKGVMLTHGQVLRGFSDWSRIIGLRSDDRYLIINPYFHFFGLGAGILSCLMTGATNLPHPVFDVPAVMRRVVEERISVLPGPPAIYQTILNDPDLGNYDLSTLRLAVTGAAVVPVDLVVQMRDRLGFETVLTGYGLTENSGLATICRREDDPETVATTSGRAMPGMDIRVVDTEGNEMPPGEPGEIWVSGYGVMKGYLDDHEQTAEAVDDDGWLHTGDIGTMDAGGNVAVTDRLKDMFIVGGFNAYPAEIESMMSAHPDLAQVAVVGIPDQRLGEVGIAFAIPTAGTTPDPQEIIAWCRREMANYKVPRQVHIVDQLPLNASNKVLKYELRLSAISDVESEA